MTLRIEKKIHVECCADLLELLILNGRYSALNLVEKRLWIKCAFVNAFGTSES